MTISHIQAAMALTDCRLYLTVNNKTGLLLSARGLLSAEGVFSQNVPYRLLRAEATLFDIRTERRFPFDEAARGIVMGAKPAFDLAVCALTPEGRVNTVFRNCAPEAPVGRNEAFRRWSFGVFPSESLWRILISEIWGGDEYSAAM